MNSLVVTIKRVQKKKQDKTESALENTTLLNLESKLTLDVHLVLSIKTKQLKCLWLCKREIFYIKCFFREFKTYSADCLKNLKSITHNH